MWDVRLVVALALVVNSAGSALEQRLSAVPVTVISGTRVVLRFTDAVSSDRKRDTGASLVTVHDLVVNNVVVIPRGALVSFEVVQKAARRLRSPGKVGIRVDGIYSRSGQKVLPLRAIENRDGEPGCFGQGCLALLFVPWLRGDNPSVPTGTLLSATVSEATSFGDEWLRGGAGGGLTRTEITGSTVNGRLHVYSLDWSSPPTVVAIDGERIGSIAWKRYECFSLSPGNHMIDVGGAAVVIRAEPGREYYVRSGIGQTDGYRFSDAVLEPARLTNGSVSCWH
ncbi:MAG: hypothetical protein ABIS06_04265 [Vicinamibacterales bacterium]